MFLLLTNGFFLYQTIKIKRTNQCLLFINVWWSLCPTDCEHRTTSTVVIGFSVGRVSVNHSQQSCVYFHSTSFSSSVKLRFLLLSISFDVTQNSWGLCVCTHKCDLEKLLALNSFPELEEPHWELPSSSLPSSWRICLTLKIPRNLLKSLSSFWGLWKTLIPLTLGTQKSRTIWRTYRTFSRNPWIS